MSPPDLTDALIRHRQRRVAGYPLPERRTLEGGCGVIGVIGSAPIAGRAIIRSCHQMRNRGNGKGGGVAAAGLFPRHRDHYALHVAYLDEGARAEVERRFIHTPFEVAHAEQQPQLDDHREAGLEVRPPAVWRYFVRARRRALETLAADMGVQDPALVEDELVFQNSFQLNQAYYVGAEHPRAFVLSHGHDLMILKGVGYAEEIARYYRLEETRAHVWIGHQRYPTRGRVWHPGGAHPFAGLHEAVVHNGDFANYYAVTEYLRQRGLTPQFTTDTEVSVLLFDHYARVLGYPLEHVIEALAPTPAGDFERLTKRRQRIYRALQTAHLHGSPDGPWFFIVARVDPATGDPQLIGITDVSMLRPQVFALQRGAQSYGAIASEKQAIDAFFEELRGEDQGVAAVADHYWNARGGSCTDGGAFTFHLRRGAAGSPPVLQVRDKFEAVVDVPRPLEGPRSDGAHPGASGAPPAARPASPSGVDRLAAGPTLVQPGQGLALVEVLRLGDATALASVVTAARTPEARDALLGELTALRDRPFHPGTHRRAELLTALDEAIDTLLDAVPTPEQRPAAPALRLDQRFSGGQLPVPPAPGDHGRLVIDARGFPPEDRGCVSRLVVDGYHAGWRQLIVYRCTGDRFIGCGLGPKSDGVRIDVYGSSGDYLGSGMDGAHIYVHGDAQDQVGQILGRGRIVIYGSVGQTFLYGAKGGEAFVRDSAAGRPLINAVGRIRAVINGTCLDYCAESFMAGERLDGGFVIINGLSFDAAGEVIGLERKYPGNNLFSLASGGACYLNDPYRTVTAAQLNGAAFVPFSQADWNVIRPYLELNEALFGISVRHDLLRVDGLLHWPKEVFRKVVASQETAGLDWSSLTA